VRVAIGRRISDSLPSSISGKRTSHCAPRCLEQRYQIIKEGIVFIIEAVTAPLIQEIGGDFTCANWPYPYVRIEQYPVLPALVSIEIRTALTMSPVGSRMESSAA